MKKHILTLSILVCSCILFAQNENPFSQFGYEAPVMQVKEQPAMDNETLFIVENQNPNSDIRWLIIDTKNQLIRLYSAEGIEIGNENLQVYTTARWLVPDPAGQYYSPYLSMGNSWICNIDPDGRDDYFDQDGNYLGTDNTGSGVRVMSADQWNSLTEGISDLSGMVDVLQGSSDFFSAAQSSMTDASSLNVYQHYNSTGLSLVVGNNGDHNMAFRGFKDNTADIEVNLARNIETGACDDFYAIKSNFDHEGWHYNDFKALGVNKYILMPLNIREGRALNFQMSQDNFHNANKDYQNGIMNYGISRGYILTPIQSNITPHVQ